MNSRHILTALATAGLIVGGQALAQGRGGGHGGGQGGGMGSGLGVGLGGSARGGIDVDVGRRNLDVNHGRETRVDARSNSRGPLRANSRARVRANENSVLRTNPVVLPDLSGLRTGLVVRNRSGVTIGTVSRIVRSDDGTIRTVLVTGADGERRRIRLAPNSLTVNGDIVTTTAVRLDD